MLTRKKFLALLSYLKKNVVGQQLLSERLIVALLAEGHVLIEGLPGLAKTRVIKTLALCFQASFKRIQFTPDILPADLTGTDIYQPGNNTFQFHPGPLFSNIVLADEINRASAKVQSALLEAMAERQISTGNKTYSLPEFFVVMATQNALDQEGTHPLPEAQLDRFLFNINVSFPNQQDEKKILTLVRNESFEEKRKMPSVTILPEALFTARKAVLKTHMDASVEDYIIRLVHNTRHESSSNIAKMLVNGVTPRATLEMDRSERGYAWFYGLDFVRPEDVQAVVRDVLRHRLKLTVKSTYEGCTPDKIISYLLNSTEIY